MKLSVKNMVSASCIILVKDALEKLGFQDIEVQLGTVLVNHDIDTDQLLHIGNALNQIGFELLQDRKSILVQQIRTLIINVVYHSEEPMVQNLSVFLSNQLHHNYTYMSNLFSEMLGITIEKFIISHKIERVKELLTYAELSLTDIAFKMHYSSVSHLSSQFKKVVGMTPSDFKQLKDNKRDMLENLC